MSAPAGQLPVRDSVSEEEWKVRVDLAEHVLRLDMGFHKLRPPGELIERIDGDVDNLAQYFSELVVNVLGNSVLVLGILALLFREEWRAGLIGLTYAVLVLVFLRAIQERIVGLWRAISAGFADMYGFIEERLLGTEDIRANGGEGYVMVAFQSICLKLSPWRNSRS